MENRLVNFVPTGSSFFYPVERSGKNVIAKNVVQTTCVSSEIFIPITYYKFYTKGYT